MTRMTPQPARVSRRIGAIAESATLAVDAKAKALKAAGRPVIGFGAGEPDFPTPDYIVEAAVGRLPRPALPPLHPGRRPARAARRRSPPRPLRDSGYEVDAAQVLVTNGGKQALYEAFAALLDPGDEVLLPAPYWTTYPESIRLAGGVPVEVLDRRDQRLPRHRRAARGGPHRRAPRCCCSSRRPTRPARSTPPEQVEAIGRWAVEHGLWVVTDEIYEHLVYGDARFASMPDAGARAGRPLRRGQRRRQDLRDDRLAGRLADRPDRRRQGRDQPAVARHLQRRQRQPGRRARRGAAATCRRSRDARGLRPAPADHRADAERDPRRRAAPSRRARSTPTRRSRACSARRSAAGARRPAPSWPS